jgi:hypothetical protein
MPAPQLHLTFAEELPHETGLADELRVAAEHEPRYLRLGAIFHDLPYYGNMPLMALRYSLRRPAEPSVWGHRIHYDRPDEFLACFVATAREFPGPVTRAERLALIAGLCSHAALDLSLHPLVNHIARREVARKGGAESHHHRVTEQYHALFYHVDARGRDVIGTREMHDKTKVTKRSSIVRRAAEPALVDLALASYRAMWGEAPRRAEWTGWVRSFAQFGVLVGGWLSRQNSLKLRTPANRALYFQSREFDFYDFMAVARRRLVGIANRAHAYFDGGDFAGAARARFIADIGFDGSLAEPLGVYGPRLAS